MGRPGFRLTIGQMMASVLVAALAMAPMPLVLRAPTAEHVVATGAYEILLLPVLTALVALGVMEPGRGRTRFLVALCATPLIVLAVGYVAAYVFTIAAHGVAIARGFRRSPGSGLGLLAYATFVTWAVRRRVVGRCPACKNVWLRAETRPVPEKKMWLPTGVYTCDRCGGRWRSDRAWIWPRMVPEGKGSPPG